MGLTKGTTNNTNGRPKGSPNKVTTGIRELFQELIESNMDQFRQDIQELAPKERVTALLKIADFVLPKFRSVEVASKFSDEEYQEYIAFKQRKQVTDGMSDEELREEALRMYKILNEED